MPDWSKIGRNNKNRGRAFEKKCAAILGWTRVPYSGGSGEWGKGDVVDGFYKRRGYWMAECKTQQPGPAGNISILAKWIGQIEKVESRRPIIITSLVGQQEAFVFLPRKAWLFLVAAAGRGGVSLDPAFVFTTKTTSQGQGFCVRGPWVKPMYRSDKIAVVNVIDRDGDRTIWRLMTLTTFAALVKRLGLYVEDDQPPEDE